MTDLRQAAQMALEALEFDGFTPEDETHRLLHTKAITALKAALEQQAEPVAWMYQHEETGRTAFIEMSEHKDGWKPSSSRMKLIGPLYTTPPQQQAKMRMPKVGDKVICLEDESLGEVVSLTAGGSPDIKFNDGTHGTYLLREFAELFGYVAPPQRPWQGLTDEEMSDTVADIDVDFGDLLWKVVCLTKIIESKLKERNT